MQDWLNGLRGVALVELAHFGHNKQLLEQEQKERQEIIIDRLRELSAPYTYYCEVGDHSWRWKSPEGVEPPGKDGENIICPEHGCSHDFGGTHLRIIRAKTVLSSSEF